MYFTQHEAIIYLYKKVKWREDGEVRRPKRWKVEMNEALGYEA